MLCVELNVTHLYHRTVHTVCVTAGCGFQLSLRSKLVSYCIFILDYAETRKKHPFKTIHFSSGCLPVSDEMSWLCHDGPNYPKRL